MSSQPQKPHPPQAPPSSPETWITAAEAAAALHLSLRTVLGRAASGKLPAKIPNDIPFTYDGKPNYLFRLEALTQNAQFQYLRNHLPAEEICSMDLVSPRSSVGDAWLNQFLNIAEIIREADAIRQQYRHTGTVKDRLQELADSHGISLATLYRLCGKTPFKELSLLYLDPVYLQPHLPKTMCLWSADFAYALFLDSFQHYSQNDIFRELLKRKGTPCDACPYAPSQTDHSGPICQTSTGTMRIPNNRRTVNRLLSHIPPQMICYCREGIRKWRSDFGHFTLRVRPLLVNELWQGDHHVFDLFVRVKITRQKNDRTYEKEIAVRPVLTAWMDTATGCLVGWVISILPNADTIAEAFCRGVSLTVGEEFHGLPKGILVDCGKDYRSALLQDLPDVYQITDSSLYLNRRFAGLGLLPALGVEIHSALPYHPQSKSIERMFGTLERQWICKLKGWCHNSVSERPAGFAQYLQRLLDNKELLTLEEFVMKFQSEILPAYHHFREDAPEDMNEWTPSLNSMSPMERYHALEKPYMVTPDWQTLSALKMHHAAGCKIRRHGIRFQNVWYWNDALAQHMDAAADVFYHAVEKPLAPSSITVTVNGRFVCEAFPAQKLPFTDADPVLLQAHLDGQRKHQQEMKKAICRINQSVAGILPPDATAAEASEKTQLRSHCYAAAIGEQTPALSDNAHSLPDSPEMTPETGARQSKTSPSSIQEVLSFLFGE